MSSFSTYCLYVCLCRYLYFQRIIYTFVYGYFLTYYLYVCLRFLGKSAEQILPVVITQSLHVCVSFCVNVCCQIDKILIRNHLSSFQHLKSKVANFVLLFLYLHFQD